MRRIIYNMAILSIITTIAGACGFRSHEFSGPTGECTRNPVSSQRNLVSEPIPLLSPTVETYPNCAVLLDDFSRDWQRRRQFVTQPPPDFYQDMIETQNATQPQPQTVDVGCDVGRGSRGRNKIAERTESDSSAPGELSSMSEAPGKPMISSNEVMSSSSMSSNESFTNIQERNVDEGDSVKIGDHHIYVLRAHEIKVVARQSLTLIGTLPLADLRNVALYADGDRLVIVATGYQGTIVRVMKAESGQLPVLQKQHDLSGDAYGSRYIGGHLVLVFRDRLPWAPNTDDLSVSPILVEQGAVNGIPCNRIVKSAAYDFDSRFVKVVSLDARNPESAPQFAAVIGGGDQIYMTASTLYVTKAGVQGGGNGYAAPEDMLLITKIDFNAETGAVAPSAVGVIRGRVKDQWAFKEHAIDAKTKVLSVATSTGQLFANGANAAQNHLWVLRQNGAALEVAAAINDFGTGEDIRAVRYVNTMAYIVTFRQTDPLFAFDLTNPLKPKLLGELKVPGFSVYMHPVAEGRILGVGFDAHGQSDFASNQGLQLSLFDVSDPMNLRRLDNQIIGHSGSSSEVTSDHHAFYFDAAAMIVGIPVIEHVGYGTATDATMVTTLKFSGAIMYHIEDKKLTEVARLSHSDLLSTACKARLAGGYWGQDRTQSYDISRLYSVDGKLLTVSRFGIKTWGLAQLDRPALATLAFPINDPTGTCGDSL